VRLHVLKAQALSGSDCGECPNLVYDQILNLTRRRSNVSSAEPNQVGKSRVGTHRNAMLPSQSDRLAHDPGVARVKSARDAGRCNGRHQEGVLAELVGPKRFTHIGIEIYAHCCEDSRVILPTFLATEKDRTSRFS
jgi:hypothetical protein